MIFLLNQSNLFSKQSIWLHIFQEHFQNEKNISQSKHKIK